jgi:hypothetical protein
VTLEEGGVWRPVVSDDELRRLHAVLQRAFDELAAFGFRGRLPDKLASDTAFAVGEALGTLSKAKALVGRDIDDAKRNAGRAGDDAARGHGEDACRSG